MIVKERGVPVELQVLRILIKRKNITEREINHFYFLEKGCEGEKRFDQLVRTASDTSLILNDLTLEVNNSIIQIDSLAICEKKIYHFEVKNYEGDFYIEDNKWYSFSSRSEIKNPLLQLERSATLLRKYLIEHYIPLSIESRIVFIHPTFTLYHAPKNIPVIFPSQLYKLVTLLNPPNGKITDKHKKFANQLIDNCLAVNPYTKLPSYDYNSINKGMYCSTCNSNYTEVKNSFLHCPKCRNIESVSNVFIRTVEEYKSLFPDRKLSAKELFDWCAIFPTIRAVRYLFNKHFRN